MEKRKNTNFDVILMPQFLLTTEPEMRTLFETALHSSLC